MPDTKRYQCRHIFTDGHRCGSPCLRAEQLCYYHHTTRRPAQNPRQRRSRQSHFDLPLPEDRASIQLSIGQVLLRIARNQIDPKRAGLLLYGLQIASTNLPRTQPTRITQPIEELTAHPELGLLAPTAEYDEDTATGRPKSIMRKLLDQFANGSFEQEQENEQEREQPGAPRLDSETWVPSEAPE